MALLIKKLNKNEQKIAIWQSFFPLIFTKILNRFTH